MVSAIGSFVRSIIYLAWGHVRMHESLSFFLVVLFVPLFISSSHSFVCLSFVRSCSTIALYVGGYSGSSAVLPPTGGMTYVRVCVTHHLLACSLSLSVPLPCVSRAWI